MLIALISFFLFFFFLILSTYCRCRGLLLHLITLSDTHTHTHKHIRLESSGRGIGPSQKLQPDNTPLWRDKQPCPPARFEPVVPKSEWSQTYAVDRAATVIVLIYWTKIFNCKVKKMLLVANKKVDLRETSRNLNRCLCVVNRMKSKIAIKGCPMNLLKILRSSTTYLEMTVTNQNCVCELKTV